MGLIGKFLPKVLPWPFNWLVGCVKTGLSALFGIVRAYPLQCALIVSLCASFWLWRGKERALDGWAKDKSAWAEQIRAANDAAQAAQAHHKQNAKEADNEHHTSLDTNRTLAAGYRDAHRVRQACMSAATASQGNSSGIPQDTATDAIVVTGRDFDACTDAATYAMSAFKWANQINPPENAQ